MTWTQWLFLYLAAGVVNGVFAWASFQKALRGEDGHSITLTQGDDALTPQNSPKVYRALAASTLATAILLWPIDLAYQLALQFRKPAAAPAVAPEDAEEFNVTEILRQLGALEWRLVKTSPLLFERRVGDTRVEVGYAEGCIVARVVSVEGMPADSPKKGFYVESIHLGVVQQMAGRPHAVDFTKAVLLLQHEARVSAHALAVITENIAT